MATPVHPIRTRYRLLDHAERGDVRYALVEVTRRGEIEVVHHIVVVSLEPILLTGRCIRRLYATKSGRFSRKASEFGTWMSSADDAGRAFKRAVRQNAKPPVRVKKSRGRR